MNFVCARRRLASWSPTHATHGPPVACGASALTLTVMRLPSALICYENHMVTDHRSVRAAPDHSGRPGLETRVYSVPRACAQANRNVRTYAQPHTCPNRHVRASEQRPRPNVRRNRTRHSSAHAHTLHGSGTLGAAPARGIPEHSRRSACWRSKKALRS